MHFVWVLLTKNTHGFAGVFGSLEAAKGTLKNTWEKVGSVHFRDGTNGVIHAICPEGHDYEIHQRPVIMGADHL